MCTWPALAEQLLLQGLTKTEGQRLAYEAQVPDLGLRGCLVQGLREKKLIESNLEKVDALRPIAKELGCSLAQLALAWCASCMCTPLWTLLCAHPEPLLAVAVFTCVLCTQYSRAALQQVVIQCPSDTGVCATRMCPPSSRAPPSVSRSRTILEPWLLWKS